MVDRSPKLKVPSAAARVPERAAAAPPVTEPVQELTAVPFDLGRIAFGTAGPDGRSRNRHAAGWNGHTALPAFRLDVPPRDAPVQRVRTPAAIEPPAFTPEAEASPGTARASARPPRPNHVGLPPELRAGVEALSGVAMDDVRVRYRSPEPARFGALAFARGRDIHLGPGQEQHLPHEAWHVVQQARGRVKPSFRTSTREGVNTDHALERDAHLMGAAASKGTASDRSSRETKSSMGPTWSLGTTATVQMITPWWKHAFFAGAGVATAAAGAAAAMPALMLGGTALAGAAAAHGIYSYMSPQPNYNQRSDPSFFGPNAPRNELLPHADFRGASGMANQLLGQNSNANDIRASANTNNTFPFQDNGNGEHEAVPTNMRNHIGPADHAMIGAQSGLRLSTGTAVLKPPGGDATGHTGLFNPNVTTGQKHAHDLLRNLPNAGSQDDRLMQQTNAMLSSLASGPEIMDSDVLTGANPTHNGFGQLGLPLSDPNYHQQTDAERRPRIEFAKAIHARREHTKDRGRSLARSLRVGREPSPERELLRDDGTGGGYKHPLKRALWPRSKSPVPTFRNGHSPVTAPHERYAHMSGWITQPYRYGGRFKYMQHD